MSDNLIHVGRFFSAIALTILISTTAFAGERVPAGTVIEEESYVFTIDEAAELMRTIEELEFKTQQQEELLVLYKELNAVSEAKQDELSGLLDIREDQIVVYKEWQQADADRIKALERQRLAAQWERWGFLALGIAITTGAIITADQLDDRVIENN